MGGAVKEIFDSNAISDIFEGFENLFRGKRFTHIN